MCTSWQQCKTPVEQWRTRRNKMRTMRTNIESPAPKQWEPKLFKGAIFSNYMLVCEPLWPFCHTQYPCVLSFDTRCKAVHRDWKKFNMDPIDTSHFYQLVIVHFCISVFMRVCPSERKAMDQVDTALLRPWRWSIFRAMRSRWFIFQQRCDTDYFWKSLTWPSLQLFSLTIGKDYFFSRLFCSF